MQLVFHTPAAAEQKAAPRDPLDELTDEELDAAIASLYEATRSETGMSPTEMAVDLAERRKQGTLPDDLSPELVRQFVQSFKAEVKANARLHADRTHISSRCSSAGRRRLAARQGAPTAFSGNGRPWQSLARPTRSSNALALNLDRARGQPC